MICSNQSTNGPVNAHLISEQIISTKPGYDVQVAGCNSFQKNPPFSLFPIEKS